jgi:hypothetical protein
LAVGLGLFLLTCLIVALSWVNSTELSEEDLAARCADSTPRWDSYQEDIKGQVGARPVAQWLGKPVSASANTGAVAVTFQVTGPWAQRTAAVPIIVKDPAGAVRVAHGTGDGAGTVDYKITLPGSEQSSVPWLEVQYPHHRERLPLNAEGKWQAD